jgi:putative aldouronate transport system substrate-binding protein
MMLGNSKRPGGEKKKAWNCGTIRENGKERVTCIMRNNNRQNFSAYFLKRFYLCAAVGTAASVVLSLCACGNTAAEQDAAGTDTTFEPVTFSFYSADGVEDPWTDPVALAITEATGVTLDMLYPSDIEENTIELMVATGELPDFIYAKGDSDILIQQNALIDLSDLIDEYGPHIKALYGDEYEKLRYSEDDPAIYQLCSGKVQEETLESAGTAQLQWAVLAYNNYEIPTTLEEYGEMIKEYKARHLSIDGQSTIGITLSVSDWHWYTTLSNPSGYIANGSTDDGQWIVSDDYQVRYKHLGTEQKEFYRWLNRMYDEQVLDPEFATQTHDDYLEKIASGRVLGLLDADWDYATPENTLKAAGKYERTYAGLPVTMDESVKCASLAPQGLNVGWGIGITTACKDPVRAVQFLDWMCSEEAQILLNWGIENVNYFYDENGVRYRTDDEIARAETDVSYSDETGVGRHVYPFPSYGNTAVDSTGNYYSVDNRDRVISEYNDQEKEALAHWNVTMLTDIFPQSDEFEEKEYTPLWSKILPADVQKILDRLDEIAWQGLIDCVVCSPDEFDAKWEQLQQNLISAGAYEAGEKMTEILAEEMQK